MNDWKNGMAYALGGAAVFLLGTLFRELLEEMEREEEGVHKDDDAPEKENSLDGIAEVNSALDDVLAYLKQRSACNIQ